MTASMTLNADFSQRVVLHAEEIRWTASPLAGVDRRMLDRVGGEVARATSIVRYAPGSHFSPHTHDGGEEFIVLEGVFQDEHGDYAAGFYVRNPPTSRHTPRSESGCTIFVKLWQFDAADRTPVQIDMRTIRFTRDARRPGVSAAPLFEDHRESVRLETWDARSMIQCDLPGGGEFFVLDGGFEEGGVQLRRFSWLRLPAGVRLRASVGLTPARVWVKTGHLLL